MDVQTENTDPPPCESQSSGKIRKGFKLFGKRKPGNIFSIRSKGDGNNKSPVIRSNTSDGLSDTAAPDSEQEADTEKGQEVSQGEREQSEEEPLSEDGVLAASSAARASISSVSSAKSLSFLSLLRGGRRGVADRRVHTVSQPASRQRRGLKALFGSVKFRSKDKEEDAPPSPLLMSSRANSVEIIKEDLTLTPKSQPRSPDSSKTESCEPDKSLTSQDSAATSPSETVTPKVMAGDVSSTNKHVPPSPITEPPLVPGDNSLSCLLADISSLLTFDSITGGGDIMADVEAEWGKASSPINAAGTDFTASSTYLSSKPTISSTAKPSPAAVPTTATIQSSTPLTKTTSTSSPIAKPSSIITTLTKTSTLTTHSVKLSSDSTPAPEPSAIITIKSTPTPIATKSSTPPVTLATFSTPIMSSMTIKSPLSSTSTATAAPPITQATVAKAPSISPALTCMASKLASEIAAPSQIIASVSKPIPVTAPTPVSAKPPPVTHSPPTPTTFTQPPPAKFDSTSTSYKPLSSAAGESKAPVIVSSTCAVATKPSSPAPVIPSKMTPVPTSTMTSGSVSAALSKPTLTSSPMDLTETPPSLVNVPDMYPPSTRAQPSPASVPAPSSLDKIPPMTKPTPAAVSLDKMPPVPTPTPTTHAVVFTASPTPPASAQMHVLHSKPSLVPAQSPISVSKDLPATAQIQVSQSKTPPAPNEIPISVSKPPSVPIQIPVSMSKDPPDPVQIQVSQTKPHSVPAHILISVSKEPPAPAQIQVSQTKPPSVPAHIPISVSKEPPAPAQVQVSQSKAPPAVAQIPVSVSTDLPAPIRIPVSPTPAPCHVASPLSTPTAWPSEAQAPAKLRGSGQASVDGQLTSPISPGAKGAQTVLSKTEEQHSESRMSLQGTPRESRIPQVKASGLSKIPVVGGGRAAKLPVRDSQHADDEASRDPPTPVLEEERPHFNSHDVGSKDKVSDVEANVPTSKLTQEESQQLPQPKVLTSVPRDSKIPVKHGAHTASQIPLAKEPPRTKIPVSKVPVRRAGTKPAAAQLRK